MKFKNCNNITKNLWPKKKKMTKKINRNKEDCSNNCNNIKC